MLSIEKCPLPDHALLRRYVREGTYTDCFATEVGGTVAFVDYVTVFYTTAVFRLERVILKWSVSRPSTDAEARRLAEGKTDTFAAWYVEARSDNQILMCDFTVRTRSWLMAAPVPHVDGDRTRLYFGSAVVPVRSSKTGESSLGMGFSALLEFHKLYSEVLLGAARSRLQGNSSKRIS